MLFHDVHGGLHRLLLAPDLAVSLDGTLIIQPHDGADVHDGGHHGRCAGDTAGAAELGHVGGEELVVDLVAVFQHPPSRLLQRGAAVPQVRRRIHQQAVAGGGAQGVDDHEFLIRVLLLQKLGRRHGVVDGAGLAGGEGDVQQIALFQLGLEEVQIGADIDLGGLGQLARLQKTVEPGQSLRVTAHVVHVLLPVHHVGIKQHGNVSALHIGIGKVHGRAAAENEFTFHMSSSGQYTK